MGGKGRTSTSVSLSGISGSNVPLKLLASDLMVDEIWSELTPPEARNQLLQGRTGGQLRCIQHG